MLVKNKNKVLRISKNTSIIIFLLVIGIIFLALNSGFSNVISKGLTILIIVGYTLYLTSFLLFNGLSGLFKQKCTVLTRTIHNREAKGVTAIIVGVIYLLTVTLIFATLFLLLIILLNK